MPLRETPTDIHTIEGLSYIQFNLGAVVLDNSVVESACQSTWISIFRAVAALSCLLVFLQLFCNRVSRSHRLLPGPFASTAYLGALQIALPPRRPGR